MIKELVMQAENHHKAWQDKRAAIESEIENVMAQLKNARIEKNEAVASVDREKYRNAALDAEYCEARLVELEKQKNVGVFSVDEHNALMDAISEAREEENAAIYAEMAVLAKGWNECVKRLKENDESVINAYGIMFNARPDIVREHSGKHGFKKPEFYEAPEYLCNVMDDQVMTHLAHFEIAEGVEA